MHEDTTNYHYILLAITKYNKIYLIIPICILLFGVRLCLKLCLRGRVRVRVMVRIRVMIMVMVRVAILFFYFLLFSGTVSSAPKSPNGTVEQWLTCDCWVIGIYHMLALKAYVWWPFCFLLSVCLFVCRFILPGCGVLDQI